ncbi:MAG: DUF2752 domain-containing protein [Bryobacterales bacterium]|nr:DUF2752 domain-containing protein [Bryobacterales bacterium]
MKQRLAIAVTVVALLWLIAPPYVASCPFRWLTGLPCPLCGMTRALFLLAKGDFIQAVELHALSPLVAAFGLALAIAGQKRLRGAWVWLGTCLLMFGALRIARLVLTL